MADNVGCAEGLVQKIERLFGTEVVTVGWVCGFEFWVIWFLVLILF